MMRRDIKMVGLDLDGTLLDSNKVFTEYSKGIVTEAIRRGVVVLPATGRPACGIPKDVMEFPGVRYAVTANGARVVDLRENRVLFECLLSYGEGRKLLEIFRKYDTYMEVYFEGFGYAQADGMKQISRFISSAPMAEYVLSTRKPVEDLYEFFCREQKGADKIQAMFANQDEKEAAFEEIRAALPDAEVTGALFNNIEVNGRGARKGAALVRLGEMLGISREEIMACGDGSNDLDMIREAGLGIAMANGIEQIRLEADGVTLSNDEDGAAKAIETYVLK